MKAIKYVESQNRTSVQSKQEPTPGEMAMQEAEYRNFREMHAEDDYEGDRNFNYSEED